MEANLQVVVSGINVQLAVNGKEELDGQGDSQQHTQLRKPQKPAAGIRVTRQGQKGNGAKQGSKNGYGSDPPGHGSVALEVFLTLHLFFGKVQTGNQNRQQIDDQYCQVNIRKTLHTKSPFQFIFNSLCGAVLHSIHPRGTWNGYGGINYRHLILAHTIWAASLATALSASCRFSRGARTPPMSRPALMRSISLATAYMLAWLEHIL